MTSRNFHLQNECDVRTAEDRFQNWAPHSPYCGKDSLPTLFSIDIPTRLLGSTRILLENTNVIRIISYRALVISVMPFIVARSKKFFV